MTYNPLKDLDELDNINNDEISKIHIRINQRTTRKSVTTIKGFDKSLDTKKLVGHFKKKFHCMGFLITDEDGTCVVQLSGDQRENVKNFFIDEKITTEEYIIVHGY